MGEEAKAIVIEADTCDKPREYMLKLKRKFEEIAKQIGEVFHSMDIKAHQSYKEQKVIEGEKFVVLLEFGHKFHRMCI